MVPFDAPPAIVGHRGAPVAAPENTPVSFQAAAAGGARWVELDVRRSADGVLVVRHDAHTPDGVAVIARTADQLAARGVWALGAVLAALPVGLGVDVEVKNVPGEPDFDEDDRSAHLLGHMLDQRIGERPWMTSSFNPLTVAALARSCPEVPAGLLHLAGLETAATASVALEHGARVLCPEVTTPAIEAARVAELHEAGLAVLVWTVDDLEVAADLAAAGVDAICTNDPARLVEALRPRGR